MKSLEHLIREIREGKTEKTEKKSLEGSIRKVMSKESSYAAKDSKPVDEHCGCEDEKKKKVRKEDSDKLPGAEDKMDEAIGTLGTDKYQGNEFKSIRTATPHITPPGPEHGHSQAPENASRQRSIAKEKAGINRVTEGKVDLALKGVTKLADTVMDIAKPYVASKSKQLVPYVSKEVQAAKSAETAAAKAAPAAAEKLPAPVSVPKTETKPQVPVVTPTATATKPQVPVVTPTATATKPQVPVVTPTTTTKPAPVAVPKTGTKTAPAVPPKGGAPIVPPKGGTPALPGPSFKLPRFAGMSGPQYVGKPWIEAPWKVHGTKAERHFKESVEGRRNIETMPRPDDTDRKNIAYVGRPADDPKSSAEKTTRQAQYKKKIIDESKKFASIIKKTTKEYESSGKTKVFDRGEDVIIINPEMNKNTLDIK